MPDLGPLFDQPVPYQRHSRTSREAAQRARAFAGSQAERALRTWAEAGERGLTDLEVHQRSGLPIHLVPRCRQTLQRLGLLVDEPIGTRTNTTGARANLWRVTREGARRAA